MTLNKTLHKEQAAKRGEFYTQLSDIENELCHYKDNFRGKIVIAMIRRSAISSAISTFFPTIWPQKQRNRLTDRNPPPLQRRL